MSYRCCLFKPALFLFLTVAHSTHGTSVSGCIPKDSSIAEFSYPLLCAFKHKGRVQRVLL